MACFIFFITCNIWESIDTFESIFFVRNLENVSITFCLRRALFNAQHKLSLRLKTSKIPLLFPAWHSASKGGCTYWKDEYRTLRYKSEVSHQFVFKSVPRSFLTFLTLKGRVRLPKRINIQKTSKGGRGHFQKFILQFLDLYKGFFGRFQKNAT